VTPKARVIMKKNLKGCVHPDANHSRMYSLLKIKPDDYENKEDQEVKLQFRGPGVTLGQGCEGTGECSYRANTQFGIASHSSGAYSRVGESATGRLFCFAS
jgi:hypothetical protein